MDLKKCKIGDIINYCQEQGQIEWLKAESAKMVEHKVYPKVPSVSKNGKKSWKEDKTQAPTIKVEPISFLELKANFVAKFFPEVAAKRQEQKKNWHDMIAKL